MRHSRVANPEGLVYARLPDFHLSEEGRLDVEALSELLAGAPVTAVYASPLDRARETAEILARPHGLEVILDDRLLEWSFWVRWQGIPWSRIRDRDPALLAAYGTSPPTVPDQDSLERCGAGVLAWAAEGERLHPDGLVLGVSHEAPLVAALLVGRGGGLSVFHSTNLAHLAAVRLRPGPPEVVDLVAWAATY